ncbi:RNA polymerase sigma-70 factor [Bacteroides fragilis]|jgi:RNA polymerase sigma-70 factor|uniref:RNA polymerase sigma-70 factor n=1 Tax=Bacteroides fragilis TaxID=817 RepID=UPI00044F434D|nr:RNA polymerase sigma-70 factor [Bacteroides fragilis]EXZ03171.1 RNA polymerase sigma-70 factor, expansion 1 family protein [Bacteroides fragilis str. DS-208]MCE8971688.1 RNA polymerase sigma-70 factor [Bacteroides fragilis]
MRVNTHPKDSSLLEAIQKGDNIAFNTLFHRYYQLLCNYGNRFVDLEDAEEIVQDSLLWVWENREVLIINVSLSSFLFTMVYRKALNRIEHNQITQRVLTQFHEDIQEVLHDVDFYQIQELMNKIDEAVAALPDAYREAFIMHRFQHMNYKKIAETLGVSYQTVAYRIQQALKLLRLELKDFLLLLLLFYYSK